MKPMLRPGLFTLCLLFVLSALSGCDSSSNKKLQTDMYIWQRVWTPEVAKSAEHFAPYVSEWHLLVAEIDDKKNAQVFITKPLQASTFRKLVAVIRINGQYALDDSTEVIQTIEKWLATQSPHRWMALEIDYDCATSQLSRYSAFLKELKTQLPMGIKLYVTALPDWMRSPELGSLLSATDRSILQVHSVLDPKRGLFDVSLAEAWITKYAKIAPGPFDVAVPDYGSRVVWDKTGHLENIVSEQGEGLIGAEQSELEAQPNDVALLLSKLQQRHPVSLETIVWFRMPLDGDRRIWSAATLDVVIRHEPLQVHFQFILSEDSAGAQRIQLVNDGNVDALPPVTIHLPNCQAADGIGGYVVMHASNSLLLRRTIARMIRVGETVPVGWTRCIQKPEEIRVED